MLNGMAPSNQDTIFSKIFPNFETFSQIQFRQKSGNSKQKNGPKNVSDEVNSKEENEAALKVETTPNLKNLHSTILLLEGPSDDLGNATKIFFLGYCVIGTIFHVNGFPWT